MTAEKNAVFKNGFYLAITETVLKGRLPSVTTRQFELEPMRRGLRDKATEKLTERTAMTDSGGGKRRLRLSDGRTREIKKLELYKNYIIKKAGITLTG